MASLVKKMNSFERLYMPSKWTNRFETPDQVLKFHNNFVKKESRHVRKSIKCLLNLSYGSGKDELFDLFGVDLSKDCQLVVFIHGGYWQELSKNLSSYIAKNFIERQCKVIIIGYSLCPKVNLQTIVNQINKALKKCIEFAQNNSIRAMKIIGHSAGAHLVACQLITSFVTDLEITLFLISGIYDLSDLPKTSVNIRLKLTKSDIITLSPLMQNIDTKNKCKIFIIIGEFDSPIFKDQSVLFYEKLKHYFAKDCLHFHKLDNFDHFNIVENFIEPNYVLIDLIVNN